MKTPLKPNGVKHFVIISMAMFFVAILCYGGGISLLVPLLLALAGMHLFYSKKAGTKLFLQLALLLTLIVAASDIMQEYYSHVSPLYIPVSSIAMLTVLLFSDLHLAFVMALLASTCVGLIAGNDIHFMLCTFLGSLTGIFLVKDARTRGKLIEAGFAVGIMQVVSYILLNTPPGLDFSQPTIMGLIKPLFLSGIYSVVVVMVTSKVFESLFGVLTNFSLLELSDFNHPLLKRLVLEAPGTYHHSLVVSNISESAADAIGANSLLTRVGAYYHDIGKMVKPEYFTENQMVDGSKHDSLEPSISRLVILNHVKEGVELAKRYKLSQRIIDFIPQHHGTGLIYYFYQRALEGAEADEKVEEENFRYPGPKPQSKETAIVLLADSVEGAVRALGEPTANRIDEVVRKVVNNKFIDGQLDECDLTLKDLERICATFSRVLGAMYHTRVKYPEKTPEKKNGNGHHHKKPAETNSHKSPAHQPGRSDHPAS